MRSLALAMSVILALATPIAVFGSASDYYTNISGHRVHRPERTERAPPGATACCRNGTWTTRTMWTPSRHRIPSAADRKYNKRSDGN
jgi:hypothetical protein